MYIVFDGSAGMNPEATVTETNLETYSIQQSPSGSLRVEGLVPASARDAYIEGKRAGKRFRVTERNPQLVGPQVLSADNWTFKPQANRVEARYAREKTVMKGMGAVAGF